MTWFGSLDLRPEIEKVRVVPSAVRVVFALERSADCWSVRLSVWFGAVPVIVAAGFAPVVTDPIERELTAPVAPDGPTGPWMP
jgi:hypothetical protein